MPPSPCGTRHAGAAAGWYLHGRYAGLTGRLLAAGIHNLLDSEPPFSLTSNFQFGFNPQVSNPLGRTFYLRASYAVR
jgi:iron complex outermembrane receptor protein